jgi:zinc transport system substrate-binding protein
VIVTNHDAYFYLGHEYNITTDALHGITPDSDATPQDVQAAITTIQNDHLTVIFLEDGTSPSAVQSIVDQTHVKVDVLTPNEEPPGPGQGDYVARQYGNLVKLENALGCH